MLGYALLFLILAVLAGVVGFGGLVVGTLALIGKVCVFVFLALVVISLVNKTNYYV